MQNRDVIVTESQSDGSSPASWGIIAAVLVIALAIALFVWQPWNATTTQSNSQSTQSTSVTQHANSGNSGSDTTGGGNPTP